MLWCWLALAWAEDPDALVEARAAERAGRPALERAACEQVVQSSGPDEPAAHRCRERLDWLRAREDLDGGLAGLELLERARRGEVEDVAALHHHPSAELRREAALWESGRVESEEALALLQPLWVELAEEPEAPLREEVGRRVAELLIAEGRLEEAGEVEGRLGTSGRHEGVELALREAARARLGWASLGVLAVFTLLAAPAAWRARAQRPRLDGALPLAVSVLACSGLAAAWDLQAGLTLLLSLPGLLLVHALSALASTGSRGAWRVTLRALAGLATLGVLGLVLHARGAWGWLGL